MATYLVRMEETNELVGIFWAQSLVELYWAIDECCDPGISQIKKLPRGGIFFPKKTKLKVPFDLGGDDETEDNFDERMKKYWEDFGKELVVSEYTWDEMTDEKGWRHLDLTLEQVFAKHTEDRL